jgi:hypothetical protein
MTAAREGRIVKPCFPPNCLRSVVGGRPHITESDAAALTVMPIAF